MKRLLMILGLCITVQAYAQHPMCSGSRKDIYSFSPGERLELRNLILDWLQTEINPAFPSGYKRYPLVSQHSAHGGMIHGTSNKIFVEWHRYYIQELEHWLTCGGITRPLGNLIGNQPLRRVNENFLNTVHHPGMPSTLERDYYIYEFEWSSLPDPDHYTSCLLPWEPEHFCILARIQEEGHTTPISTDLGSNLTASNNVALRNITVLRDGVLSMRPGGILWGNYTSTLMKNVKLLIKFETQADAQLLQHADVYLKLDNATVAQWAKVKGKSSAMTRNGSTFRLLADGGYIENFSLPSNTIKGASVVVQPKNGQQIANIYKFDLVQYEGSKLIGGERYIVEPAPKNGNKGMNTASAASEEGQLSAVKSNGSFILYPNPANSSFTILSNTHAKSKLDIDIYNSIGSKIRSYRSVVQGELISTGELSASIYVVQIVDCETKEMSNQKLIIKK